MVYHSQVNMKKTIIFVFILALTLNSCSTNSSKNKSNQDEAETETQNKKHKTGFKYVKDAEQVIVYSEKNRFAAWPANNGAWIFSEDELLVNFTEAPYELKKHEHNIGSPDLQTSWLARSKDGGGNLVSLQSEEFCRRFWKST